LKNGITGAGCDFPDFSFSGRVVVEFSVVLRFASNNPVYARCAFNVALERCFFSDTVAIVSVGFMAAAEI
jgi:hypothetical protein